MLREEAADCGQVILAAEDAQRTDGVKSDRSGNGMTAVEGGSSQSNDGTVEHAGSHGQDGRGNATNRATRCGTARLW